MVYVSDEQVHMLLPLEDVMSAVMTLLTQEVFYSGLVAEDTLGGIHLATKGGYVVNQGYGVRIRTEHEGRYTTLVWDTQGTYLGTIDASSLTYVRTAALLLALPFARQLEVQRVLVAGTGKLGSACIALLQVLYPETQIAIWSPGRQLFRSSWLSEPLPPNIEWWEPTWKHQEPFDIVLTCTRAHEPLSVLQNVLPHYIGVGGAVNHGRRELPSHWLVQADHLCADDPQRAQSTCGDLSGYERAIIPSLHTCLKSPDPLANCAICFICGIGAIDIGLAFLVLTRYLRTAGRQR